MYLIALGTTETVLRFVVRAQFLLFTYILYYVSIISGGNFMGIIAAIIIAIVVYYVLAILAHVALVLAVIGAIIVFFAIYGGSSWYGGRRL